MNQKSCNKKCGFLYDTKCENCEDCGTYVECIGCDYYNSFGTSHLSQPKCGFYLKDHECLKCETCVAGWKENPEILKTLKVDQAVTEYGYVLQEQNQDILIRLKTKDAGDFMHEMHMNNGYIPKALSVFIDENDRYSGWIIFLIHIEDM